MAKRSKRREWTKDDVRELKTLARSKDASSKNREVAQADTRRNAAEGVCARCAGPNFFWTPARRIWIDKGAINTGA
jgi:hypothetical protein